MHRYTILKSYPHINYVLVLRNHVLFERYVAAYDPRYENGETGLLIDWSQGHYFDDIDDAIDYIRGKEAHYVRKNIEWFNWLHRFTMRIC